MSTSSHRAAEQAGLRLVKVHEQPRPEGDEGGTCLRPLGMCDLGGCCDVCWYNPDNVRKRLARERRE